MKKITFAKLIARANEEDRPMVEVADGVIGRLELGQESVIAYRPLAWLATASSAAAVLILTATYFVMHSAAADGISDIYQTISWAAQ